MLWRYFLLWASGFSWHLSEKPDRYLNTSTVCLDRSVSLATLVCQTRHVFRHFTVALDTSFDSKCRVRHFSTLFDTSRHFSTLFDTFRHFSTLRLSLPNEIRYHFRHFSTLFDTFRHFSTLRGSHKCRKNSARQLLDIHKCRTLHNIMSISTAVRQYKCLDTPRKCWAGIRGILHDVTRVFYKKTRQNFGEPGSCRQWQPGKQRHTSWELVEALYARDFCLNSARA